MRSCALNIVVHQPGGVVESDEFHGSTLLAFLRPMAGRPPSPSHCWVSYGLCLQPQACVRQRPAPPRWDRLVAARASATWFDVFAEDVPFTQEAS